MVSCADDVRFAATAISRAESARRVAKPAGILANIETPKSFRLAAEIATADPRVAGLQLGFVGKSAIHPSQVAIINAVFRPTEAEIAHSLEVVASAHQAAQDGVGAWTVDGKMIDAPFVARARAILAPAMKLGLVAGSTGTGWE